MESFTGGDPLVGGIKDEMPQGSKGNQYQEDPVYHNACKKVPWTAFHPPPSDIHNVGREWMPSVMSTNYSREIALLFLWNMAEEHGVHVEGVCILAVLFSSPFHIFVLFLEHYFHKAGWNKENN